jgi:hypothetical protein
VSLVGRKVKVTFTNWPIGEATYTYEGHDETGHFLRRKDGTQRHIAFEFVVGVDPVDEDVPEDEF